MSKIIPYGRQNISDADITAVINVLRSDFLTQGELVPDFEKAVSNYVGAKYGVAVNSATSALHIACLALNVAEGDVVWTTPISFVASSNCALYCGAAIDFVDIEEETFNLSTISLEKKLKEAKIKGKLPKVVIPVHLCGHSCDMKKIFELSKEYGFKIIEDASHAIGGKYNGSLIGSCKYSDITIFSFHPVKIITTGEGGMAMTNDLKILEKLQRLRSHGITRNASEMTNPPDGPWYYQQIELGYNYRMTDMQAALGLSQLKKIDDFVKSRNEIASSYDNFLKNHSGFKIPNRREDTYSAFHLYVIRVTNDNHSSQISIFEKLRANGIFVNLHYIPIYRHPYYHKMGFDFNNFPVSEKYYKEAITLPIYPGLTEKDVEIIVNVLTSQINFQTLF
jgi:UDP-4-amino-4,6-dideoxy-N-acetyl-beta-L-altrosamine transaminase